MSTTSTIKTKLLDNGNTLIYGEHVSMEAKPSDIEKVTQQVTEWETNTVKLKIAYDRENDTNINIRGGFGPYDHPMKLYVVFILNAEDKTVHNKAGEFYELKDAENMMDDIKENSSKYVDKDGKYIASIKLVIEAGRIRGDQITLGLGSTVHDKRFQFVM